MGGWLVQKEFISDGMYWTVQGAEEVAFNSKVALEAADQSFPKLNKVFDMGAYYNLCQMWNVKPAPAIENKAVTSSIPTLVLSGEYDPITPPGYGWLAAQTLRKSWYYQFPGVGHGVSIGDLFPYEVTLAFWAKPTVKPDIACVSLMTAPRFYPK